MTDKDPLLDYYERATCSLQWMEFNRAFAAELSAGLPPEEIRHLFHRIGERLAGAMPLERCNTLDELQSAFNKRWQAIAWGFCTLHDRGAQLEITHACSPLAVAFGPASGGWAAGFFEGAYQAWFAGQGIPASLRVRAQASDSTGLPQVQLSLSRVPA